MSFNKYYQDELVFLREMGKEFARAHPAAAPMLAEKGTDPDVERLLEGFAFLTGRLRQKLDDEFPELTHGLMNLLWPHYLRPIPSMSIVEFFPTEGAVRDRQPVRRGVELASVPVEGTPCRFRTCFDVDLYPLRVDDAMLQAGADGRARLVVRLKLHAGVTLDKLLIPSLRFHLFGDPGATLYLWLRRYAAEIRLRAVTRGQPGPPRTLAASALHPVGFGPEHALLPYPSNTFDGYRLVQEYFALPEKFFFVDLLGGEAFGRLGGGDGLEVEVVFTRPLPDAVRVTRDHVRLFCTPVVNLFEADSEPVRVDHQRVEYRVRPEGSNPQHYEVYSVDRAWGRVRRTAQERVYEPFYSFKNQFAISDPDVTYYATRLRTTVVAEGTDLYVSFVNAAQDTVVPPTETVVFRLTCTTRNLASKLRVGDIKSPTDSSPEFARFENISRVTPSVPPPVGGDLSWRLISHMALNRLSLTDAATFRGVLQLYNRHAQIDRQAGLANERRLNGIQDVRATVEDRLFRGAPVRGRVVEMGLREDHFASDGDLFLFGSVVAEFLALYASINAFSELHVQTIPQGERYEWPAKIGRQILL